MTGDASELAAKARAVLDAGPPLRLAVLFGSRATGRARPDSDIDIGFIPCDQSLSLWEEGKLASDLELALGLPVDLVRLDAAPLMVRWQVVKCGVVILERTPDDWARFAAHVMAEHADFAPMAQHLARSFLRHVAAEE